MVLLMGAGLRDHDLIADLRFVVLVVSRIADVALDDLLVPGMRGTRHDLNDDRLVLGVGASLIKKQATEVHRLCLAKG